MAETNGHVQAEPVNRSWGLGVRLRRRDRRRRVFPMRLVLCCRLPVDPVEKCHVNRL